MVVVVILAITHSEDEPSCRVPRGVTLHVMLPRAVTCAHLGSRVFVLQTDPAAGVPRVGPHGQEGGHVGGRGGWTGGHLLVQTLIFGSSNV